MLPIPYFPEAIRATDLIETPVAIRLSVNGAAAARQELREFFRTSDSTIGRAALLKTLLFTELAMGWSTAKCARYEYSRGAALLRNALGLRPRQDGTQPGDDGPELTPRRRRNQESEFDR